MKIPGITVIACVLIVLLLACSDDEIDFDSPLNYYSRETSAVERALWLELGKETYSEFTDEELATVNRLKVDYSFPYRILDRELMLLSRCINLTELELHSTGITHIKWVAKLTKLTKLILPSYEISDLRPLSGLRSLRWLNLQSNDINDIGPLAGLNDLDRVMLGRNHIVSLNPLVNNRGLSQGDTVDVRGNPLSDASKNEHIPALEARGIIVKR